MRLYVYVLEARGLPTAKPSDGGAAAAGVYAKLKVGKHKSRTRALRGTLDPVWNQEFVFRMEDDEEGEELEVGVFREAEGGGGGELLGRVRLPVHAASGEGVQTVPPTWLSLQPRHHGAKSKAKDCGACASVSRTLISFRFCRLVVNNRYFDWYAGILLFL